MRLFPFDAAWSEVTTRVFEICLYIHAVNLIGLTHGVSKQESIMVAHVAQAQVVLSFGDALCVAV